MTLHPSDEPLDRALQEVVRSLRGLITRTRGIQDLGGAQGDPMHPILQRSRSLLRHLQEAVREMSVFDEEASLRIDVQPSGSETNRIVLRCVESLLDDHDAGGAKGARKPKPDMEGHARSLGVPEVLSFLESLDKSGALEIVTVDEKFTVVLEEGEVVHATSDQSPPGHRLGDFLVHQGSTTENELRAFLAVHGKDGKPLGEKIVAEGIATTDELEEALEQQIQHLFRRLFAAENATFRFYDGATNPSTLGVHMNLTRLLLETSFEADDREHERVGE